MDVLPTLRRNDPAAGGLFSVPEYDDVARFFRSRPDLASTPLHRLAGLAGAVGLGDILVKDESRRFGLTAFKILGVAYAVHRLVHEGALAPGSVLTCASTGNHGRAVAHAARRLGLVARVYVPEGTAPARIAAIAGEGAEVVREPEGYDAAVRRAAADAARHGWTVVSDTAWPGYERIPRLIMAGYTWLLEEAAVQWSPDPPPDLVLVQAGVGGLACAVASWIARRYGASRDRRPFVIVCEPEHAACVMASVRQGRPVTLEGPLDTVMSGLRCAEMSPLVWPVMRDAVDAFASIDDGRVAGAMARLARPARDDPAIEAGASGACGLAVLLALLDDPRASALRDAARIGRHTRALVINTEGATDPEHYRSVVSASSAAGLL